jgi:hypothetical protein
MPRSAFEEINGMLGPHGTLAVVAGYKGQVTRGGDGKTIFTSKDDDYTNYQLAAFGDDGELAALLNADGRVYLAGAAMGRCGRSIWRASPAWRSARMGVCWRPAATTRASGN